ncbi:MAG: hypothetical protein RBS39_11215 [Phycisphaerales bacterium]|nr:hypothetical protein [Phycisphaerales bacterium]
MTRAFTLLETLLAIALSSLLLGGLMGLTVEVGRNAERLSERADRERSVDALFDRLEQDLMFAIVADEGGHAGVRGDATSIEIIGDQAMLAMPGATSREGGAWASSGVRFDAASGGLTITRSGGASEVVPARIGAVRLRYHDGRGWTDAWDSAKERALPRLVEVAVWYDAEEVDSIGAEPLPGGMAREDRAGEGDLGGERPEFEDVDAPAAAPSSAPRREPRMGSEADRRRIIAIPDAGGGAA